MRHANEEFTKDEIVVQDTITVEGKTEGVNSISKEEAEKLKPILRRFLDAYKARNPEESDSVWLSECYRKELPNLDSEEINRLTEDTLASIKEYDSNLADAEEAAKKGISSEKWLSDRILDAGKNMAVQEFGRQLSTVDMALTNANAQMMRTVTTNARDVSQCMNLDGFIAEQHHVNTFNANAALKNSDHFAEVKVPEAGETYGKNSFDVVVKNKLTGKVEQQYQVKYGATAKETIKLLKNGNYNNQRFLVPAEQVKEVQAAFPGKTVTATLGGEELGVSSNPLTKEQAKAYQEGTQQRGEVPQIDYNAFQTKDLALHIAQNAGVAGLQAAAIAGGMTLLAKAANGENVDSDEMIETALTTGADAGIKAAATGAVTVGVRKGILTIIPPGTPVHAIANVVCVGIENIKILAKVASGELTMQEALDKMGRTTTAMIYGLSWGGAGALMGAAALAWIPIVGPFVGGLVGGMVGYMAGSKFGETIYNGAKKIVSTAKKAVSKAWEGVKSFGRKIASGFRSVGRSIRSVLGL